MKKVHLFVISWTCCMLMGVGTIISLNMSGVSMGTSEALLIGVNVGVIGIVLGYVLGA